MGNKKNTYGSIPTVDDNYNEVYNFMGIDPNQVGKPVDNQSSLENLKIPDGNPKEQTKSKAKAKNEPESEDDIVEGEDNGEEIEEDEETIEESLEDTESVDDLEEKFEDSSNFSEEEEYESSLKKKRTKDSIPLGVYLELKNKYKESKRKNAEYEDKLLEQEDVDLQDSMIKELVDEGFDENLARIQAKYIAKIQAKSRKTSNFEQQIIDDLTDLAEDDYFNDALDYKIPVIKMIKDYKSKGIDLKPEQAYLQILGTAKLKSKTQTDRIKQTRTKQLETKRKGNMQYKKASHIDSSGTPGKFKLSSDDLKALRELQKVQPFAGWTKQKYWKMQNNES